MNLPAKEESNMHRLYWLFNFVDSIFVQQGLIIVQYISAFVIHCNRPKPTGLRRCALLCKLPLLIRLALANFVGCGACVGNVIAIP